MPLKKGKSKNVQQANIKELIKTKPSKARAKAIKTIAKKRGISPKKAKIKHAVAIAISKSKNSSNK